MKRMNQCFALAVSLMILLITCSKESDDDAGFISIDGSNYVLTYGLVNDVGSNTTLGYRNFWLRFQSSAGDKPEHFIVFLIYSNDTLKIGEGNYNYDVSPESAGDFSWIKVGYNIQYDNAGEATDGTFFYDSDVKEGTLVITKAGDEHKFEFNITFDKNNIVYTITGEFKDVLHEGFVYYSYIKKLSQY
jgi:hypothetical protein